MTQTQIEAMRPTPRPTLTKETVVEYIEWIMKNHDRLSGAASAAHMAAAELVTRTLMGDAQAKATQHTLIEEGIIAK